MLFDDPEAPTTITKRYDYGPLTGGRVRGSVVIDADSIVPLDPRNAPAHAPRRDRPGDVLVDATQAPPGKQASNFLVVDPERSATGNTLAVMGPQLGYYYPEIVQQIHLSGPGIEAQGVGGAGDGDVHPDRPYARLRVEPHLGQPRRARRVRRAAVRARRLGADARDRPLPVRRRVPAVRRVRRGHAQRHADPLPDIGARTRDRNGDGGRRAVRVDAPSARRSVATGSTSRRSRT